MQAATGYVYFVQKGDVGPVKIGFAKDVRQRCNGLQTSSEQRLCLLGVIPGTPALEKKIHAELRHHRLSGEWFCPAPDVLLRANAGDVQHFALRQTRPKPPSKLREWRIAHYLTLVQMAAKCGVTNTALSQIENGLRPCWDTMLGIAKATGGEILPNDFLPADFLKSHSNNSKLVNA